MQTKKSYLNIGAGLLFLLIAACYIANEVLNLTESGYADYVFRSGEAGFQYVLGIIPAVLLLILGIMFLMRASNYLIPILFLVLAVVTVLPFIIWELPDLIDNKSSNLWNRIITQVVNILPYLFAAGVTAKGVSRKKGHGGTLDSWPVPGTIAFTIGLISFAEIADGLCDQFKLIGNLFENDSAKSGVSMILVVILEFCLCFFIPLALLLGCKWFAKSEVREARPAPVPYNGFNAPAPAYVQTPAPAPAPTFAPPAPAYTAPAQNFVPQPAPAPAPQPEPVAEKKPVGYDPMTGAPIYEEVAEKVEEAVPQFEQAAEKIEEAVPEFEAAAEKVEEAIPEAVEEAAGKIEDLTDNAEN